MTASPGRLPLLWASFGAALRRRSRLPTNLTITMDKLTFSQRIERMRAASQDLRDALELLVPTIVIIEEEAAAMKAAEQRFAAKKTEKKSA